MVVSEWVTMAVPIFLALQGASRVLVSWYTIPPCALWTSRVLLSWLLLSSNIKIINGFRTFLGYENQRVHFSNFWFWDLLLSCHRSLPSLYVHLIFVHFTGMSMLEVTVWMCTWPELYLVQNRQKRNTVKRGNLNFLPHFWFLCRSKSLHGTCRQKCTNYTMSAAAKQGSWFSFASWRLMYILCWDGDGDVEA